MLIVIARLLDAIGIGLILPVMPRLMAEIHGGSVGDAAVWGGLLATAFAVMQFVFGPVVGALSDRFGGFSGEAGAGGQTRRLRSVLAGRLGPGVGMLT